MENFDSDQAFEIYRVLIDVHYRHSLDTGVKLKPDCYQNL